MHRTSKCTSCDSSLFLWTLSVMTDWTYFHSWNLGFLSLFSALLNWFAAYEQYLITEAYLHHIDQPPLIRISKCFHVFVHHLQSFVEKLLKSTCRFGTKSVVTVILCQKEKCHGVFLPWIVDWTFCHVFWFDLLIFWSVESILYSKSKSFV